MTDPNRDPDRIQREIYETQARMSRTIDEIQDRIQPRRLVEQVSHMFGSSKGRRSRGAEEHASGRHLPSVDARHLAEGARENLLPIALIGLGIGWLVWSSTSHPAADRRLRQAGTWARRRAGYGSNPAAAGDVRNLPDRYRNDLGMAYGSEDDAYASEYHYRDSGQEQPGRGYVDRMRGAVSGYAEDVAETVSDYAGRASHLVGGRGDRNAAGGGLWDMVERHPLASGVIGFAVGAAAGMAIPSSRYEDEYFGRYRDSLLEQGRGLGTETVERAAEVARNAAQAGYEAAKDAVREDVQQAEEGRTSEERSRG